MKNELPLTGGPFSYNRGTMNTNLEKFFCEFSHRLNKIKDLDP